MPMYTLDTFYKSKEWQKLLQVIKLDRLTDSDEIICEHCHKAIVRAYDCIGHHIIYLTEDNVNDVNISLNPDNIALVHHKCHNKIHNKLGYVKRNVYLVHGSPLSGKTSYVNEVCNEGDLIIDIDNIWQCVSAQDRYTKPRRLNACVFAVRDTLIDCVKYRRGKWLNAYVIGTYPLISDRERMCKDLGATEIHIDTDKDECINRLLTCGDGRDIDTWTRYIDDYFRYYNAGIPPIA